MIDRWESADVSGSYSIVFRTASVRKMRLFAVAVARSVWPDSPHPMFDHAVEATERLADSASSEEERRQATADGHSFDRRLMLTPIGTRIRPDEMHVIVGRWILQHFMSDLPAPDGPLNPDWIMRLRHIPHELFGDNPYRPGAFRPTWRTTDSLGVARAMYDSRDFAAMPILADALEDAGCDSADVLAHCRGDGPHVRGCWVVDLVLGKA